MKEGGNIPLERKFYIDIFCGVLALKGLDMAGLECGFEGMRTTTVQD